MLKTILLIGVGGAIGTILRFLLTQFMVGRISPISFPYGTLIVNVSGCFVIGLVYALSDRLNMSAEFRAFLATGICGGYTTFSAFSYQSISLLKEGHTTQFFTYIIASLVLGLVATFIPVALLQKGA